MHVVVETRAYLRAAEAAGLGERDRDLIVDLLARNPDAGTEIPGTGGCRKLRFGARGGGKSGGFRTITFYSGQRLPVFLITVFSKRERSDLSQAERNALRQITKAISETYHPVRILPKGTRA